MMRTALAGLLACLVLAPAATAAQQAGAQWVEVSVDRGVVLAVDTASIRVRGPLRTVAARLSSPDSPRSMEMTFAVDCAAITIGLDGDTRGYDNGKLISTTTPPEDARAQQRVDGAPEYEKVIALVCAAEL